MKVLKGIFVYTMIIIGAILGVGILLLGSMYLFKMPVFGYRFLNVNIKKNDFANIDLNNIYNSNSENSYLNYISDLESDEECGKIKFVIDAGNYTVRLQPDSGKSTYINYYTLSDFTGLVKTDSKTYDAVVKLNAYVNKDQVLVIEMKVTNPTGLINYNHDDNELVIVVPEKYKTTKFVYDFDITTTGGNIVLKNSVTSDGDFDAPLRVNSLTAKTNKGDITFGGFDIKEGEKVASDVAQLSDLTLSTKGGTIDFTNFKKFTIENKLVLESTKADYIFETLDVYGGMEVNGTNVLIKADVINCKGDFIYKSETGGLDIGVLNAGEYDREEKGDEYYYTGNDSRLHNISIFSDSSNINIGAIMGKTRIENEYGKITVKNLCNQAIIKNENGDINIEKSGILPATDGTITKTDTSSMVLYNTYGSITVGEYYQNGLFYNKKGKIILNAKAEEDYYTKVETKDGNVELTTAGSAYNVVATDKANISIIQKTVFASDYIESDVETENKTYYAKSTNGNISIVLPTSNSDNYNYRDGYIINIDGKFGAKPTSTFSSLQENTYQWYFTGDTNKSNGVVISADKIEGELNSLPLIRLVGNKTYITASI